MLTFNYLAPPRSHHLDVRHPYVYFCFPPIIPSIRTIASDNRQFARSFLCSTATAQADLALRGCSKSSQPTCTCTFFLFISSVCFACQFLLLFFVCDTLDNPFMDGRQRLVLYIFAWFALCTLFPPNNPRQLALPCFMIP